MAKAVKKRWTQLAWLTAIGFAWTKLGLGAAARDVGVITPPAPSCPVGENPRWFGKQQIINGRSVGPGWVCLPVEITRL